MNPEAITIAITVSTEAEELTRLLTKLTSAVTPEYTITVQMDSGTVTPQVRGVVDNFRGIINTVCETPLSGDFASFKNNLRGHCSGAWIFQIDADEVPSTYMLRNLPALLEKNREVEMFYVPRINIVDGISEEHLQKWGWNINKSREFNIRGIKPVYDFLPGELELLRKFNFIEPNETDHEDLVTYITPVINFPDSQTRIYHNNGKIRWYNKVHEVISGYNMFSSLPESMEWCLMHHKTIDKQTKQNEFYTTFNN